MEELMWWGAKAVFAVGGIAGAGLALLYTLQEKLIYVPKLPGLPNIYTVTPERFGLHYEDVEFKAKDGTKLHAWFMYPADWRQRQRQRVKKRPTILFFQENAGNMSIRLPYLRMLARTLQCSIFAPSYRGYGRSGGSPNEAGLKQDADASLEVLLQRQDINPSKVVVLGNSMGAAVSIYLASKNKDKFAAAVFENTFTRMTDLAPKVLPFLKLFVGPGRYANFLIRNKWNSLDAIKDINGLPLLMLSSQMDELLPPIMMRQLYEAVTERGAKSVTWVEFKHAGHMDAYEVAAQEYWPAMMQFFKQHGLGQDRWTNDEELEEWEKEGDDLVLRPGAAAVQDALDDGSAEVDGVRAEHDSSDLRRRH